MIETQESLREQVMISQFEMATGCTRDQSKQILQAARWEFETALSLFFQEANVPSMHRHAITTNGGHLAPGMAPCNTPATPPSFPEALLALQKLQTSGGSVSSAGDWGSGASVAGASSNLSTMFCPSAKVLASFNPVPLPAQASDGRQTQQQTCSTICENDSPKQSQAQAPFSVLK